MSTATIHAGICGFVTTVVAQAEDDTVKLTIASDCQAMQKLAEHLQATNPYKAISFLKTIEHQEASGFVPDPEVHDLLAL